MASKYDTPWAETEVLMSIMSEDPEHARQLLGEMLPGELGRFTTQVDEVLTLCEKEGRRRRESDER